jgi:hypothetical protein
MGLFYTEQNVFCDLVGPAATSQSHLADADNIKTFFSITLSPRHYVFTLEQLTLCGAILAPVLNRHI